MWRIYAGKKALVFVTFITEFIAYDALILVPESVTFAQKVCFKVSTHDKKNII